VSAPGRAERAAAIRAISEEVVACCACPRLVAWREAAAAAPPRRYVGERYWARPLPGFGDPDARVLIVGLAPAAHGGNRTGRVFTGDRSGDFLFASLHRIGFASQPTSEHRDDGLELTDAYITAVNRCPPPGNRPTPVERDTCLPFLERELTALDRVVVAVALGALAWDGVLRAETALGQRMGRRPRFAHAAETQLGPRTLLGSFHPSQQNTFTGKLTAEMLDEVFVRARALAGLPRSQGGTPGIA
jgi:uracil-DNA glycosylase family 4